MNIPPERISEHLNSISREHWESLFALLPELKATKPYSEIVFPESSEPTVAAFPGWVHADALSRFIDAFYELRLAVNFDWMNWEEGLRMLNDPNADFTTRDAPTLCKLLTAAIRADRFNDGFLATVFQNGNGVKIIEALKGRCVNR